MPSKATVTNEAPESSNANDKAAKEAKRRRDLLQTPYPPDVRPKQLPCISGWRGTNKRQRETQKDPEYMDVTDDEEEPDALIEADPANVKELPQSIALKSLSRELREIDGGDDYAFMTDLDIDDFDKIRRMLDIKEDIVSELKEEVQTLKGQAERRSLLIDRQQRMVRRFNEERSDLFERIRVLQAQVDNLKDEVSETQEKVDQQKNCIACFDAVKTVAFIPCGHLCMCEACLKKQGGATCPYCREKSTSTIKIYVA
jgi:archaellum component FlaC